MYVEYSNTGYNVTGVVNKLTYSDGTEIYSSENTNVTANIRKVKGGYEVTAYRNRNDFDFTGQQVKFFKTIDDARKAVKNGFIKAFKKGGD